MDMVKINKLVAAFCTHQQFTRSDVEQAFIEIEKGDAYLLPLERLLFAYKLQYIYSNAGGYTAHAFIHEAIYKLELEIWRSHRLPLAVA